MLLKGSCHCGMVHFEVESYTPYPYMRCYCSICRKTAGGGGYAINIMGESKTLTVKGKPHIQIYNAILGKTQNNKIKRSKGQRHFCKNCASCLWLYDPTWPKWVYPFASAIDSPLPKPPENVHILLNSAASWCDIPSDKNNITFQEFPELSIEDWHKSHHLYLEEEAVKE